MPGNPLVFLSASAAPPGAFRKMHITVVVLSILLLASEQIARFCATLYYCLSSQLLCFWVTLALLLPGYLAQALSFLWFQADGHKPCWSLMLIHMLQLGVWKRYCDALWSSLKARETSVIRELRMQLGELAILRFLEALLQSLPNLLLQVYACVVMEANGIVLGLSAGIGLISLSWALVSYSYFMCLLKPGHLSMPGAALLCHWLWRTGMIGTRVMTLVLFARTYHFWVFVAAGAHWLVMSYWIVAQQTDIFQNPCQWRLFNFLAGATYIFCYISFKDGPSCCRVTAFYIVMLSENILLLLMAVDFLHGNLWGSLWIIGAVMSGFFVGSAALVIYYTFLHPKSTEIWQHFLKRSCSVVSKGSKETNTFSFQSTNQPIKSIRISGLSNIEVSHVEPAIEHVGMSHISSLVELEGYGDGKDSWENHHRWLLIKLAFKTGNISKINAGFGEGDIGYFFPVASVKHKQSVARLDPRRKLIFSTKERFSVSPKSRVTGCRFLAGENKATDTLSRNEDRPYVTLPSNKHVAVEFIPEECNNPLVNPAQHITLDGTDLISVHECCPGKRKGKPVVMSGEGEQPMQEVCTSSTVYFTASIRGDAASPDTEGKLAAVGVANLRAEPSRNSQGRIPQDSQLGREGELLLTSGHVSPVLAVDTNGCLQSSPVLPRHYSAPSSPKRSDQEAMLREYYNASETSLYGTWVAVLKGNWRSTEEPWLTSTPKTDSPNQDDKR